MYKGVSQSRRGTVRDCVSMMLATEVLVVFLALAAPSLQLPTYIRGCVRDDPNFNECARDTLQSTLQNMINGEPSLDIPPLDPLHVPETRVEYRQGDVLGKMIVKNSDCQGLKDAQILAVRTNLVDPTNMTVEVDFKMPTTFAEGEYKAEGKIAAFPISGKGVYNISMSDVSGTLKVYGDLVDVNGEQYFKVRRVGMRPEVGDMKVYASNLFTGSTELNTAALEFANRYWPVLYKELLPFAERGWDEFLRGMLNRVTLKIPFRQMVLDS